MIVFRADGNPDIGSGHIMRCLAIADAAVEAGKRCLFITADADFEDVITGHGHGHEILQTDAADLSYELKRIKKLLSFYHPKVLFIDSYYVTCDYLESLYRLCREIRCLLVYIDDVAAFAYPCDILVNYNIYGPDMRTEYERLYKEENRKIPQLFLGPEFAPLRTEFCNIQNRVLKRDVQNILISTGGSDPEHMSLRMIEKIKEYRDTGQNPKVYFHFVVGKMNDDKKIIEGMTQDIPCIVLHYNVSDMSRLMQSCDIAISAAGSTLYELCATQTPGVTYILADNQIPGAKGFESHGVLKNCGDIRQVSPEELAGKLLEEAVKLAKNYNERVRISIKMKKITDGYGSMRIIERILTHFIWQT